MPRLALRLCSGAPDHAMQGTMKASSYAALLALAALAALPPACDDATTDQYGALTELTPDCRTCLETLAECASTAQNESQFVGCRDVFQECEMKMQLGPDECGRPRNAVACDLCRERADGCSTSSCDLEFSVCKAFLMSRDQEGCKRELAQAPAEDGSCDVCVSALTACAATGELKIVCMKSFYTCRNANQIEPAACPDPSADQICASCDKQYDVCLAAGEEGCGALRDQCVSSLGASATCGGGAGGGGAGGGGPGPETGCLHDPCATGEAETADCDPCVSAVCGADSFCCDSSWDDYCVSEAQAEPACGCTPAVVCAHDLCQAGDALDPACDACAASVCEADGFCCTTGWDDLCVGRAEDLCALTCST